MMAFLNGDRLIEATPVRSTSVLCDFCSSYDEYFAQKQAAEEEWKNSDALKRQYKKDFKKFLQERLREYTVSDAAKNYHLLNREILKRNQDYNPAKYMGVDILNNKSLLIDIMESYENIDHIKKIYISRKLCSNSEKNPGISQEEAKKIKYCLRQGRELYLSGRYGGHIVKPLNYFYSITSFAYAVILLNSPFRYKLESLSNSHGVDHKLVSGNITFGGDIQQGTFSELFYALCTEQLTGRFYNNDIFSITINRLSAIKVFQSNRFTATLETLLSITLVQNRQKMSEK